MPYYVRWLYDGLHEAGDEAAADELPEPGWEEAGLPEPDLDAIQQMLNVVPTDSKVAYEQRLVTGDPATEIVRLAKDENVDMIVMGTHGRTGLRRLLMGSVAEAIVRRAHCPVFTFKEPHSEQVEELVDATARTA